MRKPSRTSLEDEHGGSVLCAAEDVIEVDVATVAEIARCEPTRPRIDQTSVDSQIRVRRRGSIAKSEV